MNIQGHRKLEMAWPLCSSCSTEASPHDEVLLRHVLERGQRITPHIATDNGKLPMDLWTLDKNPESGQILKTVVGPAPALKDGVVNVAMSLKFDPQTQQAECARIESANGNYSSHLEWDGAVLRQMSEKRVLADGRTETLSLVVDKQKGVIRYEQDVK